MVPLLGVLSNWDSPRCLPPPRPRSPGPVPRLSCGHGLLPQKATPWDRVSQAGVPLGSRLQHSGAHGHGPAPLPELQGLRPGSRPFSRPAGGSMNSLVPTPDVQSLGCSSPRPVIVPAGLLFPPRPS